MNMAVICGSARKGSAWTLVQTIKGELSALGEYHFSEHTLPNDLPAFCHGHMTCLGRGREAGFGNKTLGMGCWAAKDSLTPCAQTGKIG